MKVKRVIVDEMPKSCDYCPLLIGNGGVCTMNKRCPIDVWDRRPSWCPLEVETDAEAPKEVKE